MLGAGWYESFCTLHSSFCTPLPPAGTLAPRPALSEIRVLAAWAGDRPRRMEMSGEPATLKGLLERCGHGVSELEHQALDAVKRVAHFKHEHPPVHNTNDQLKESFTPMERVAL